MDLIDQLQFNQVIIFVSQVHYAVKLNEVLNKNAIPSKAIHGRMSLEEREVTHDERFKSGLYNFSASRHF